MTITIREIFDRLPEWEGYECDYSSLCEALGLGSLYPDNWEELNTIFKMYPISPWYCTDTWVGGYAVTFENQPFAFMYQSARKNYQEWSFFSDELVAKARNILAEPMDGVRMLALDTAIDDYYTVNYGAQLLDYSGTVDGRPAEVVAIWDYGRAFPATKNRPEYRNDSKRMSRILVRFEDGEEQEVECNKLHLPLRIVQPTAVTA